MTEKPSGPHMKRVCCVCKVHYGWIACHPKLNDLDSHGLCSTHEASEMQRIEDEIVADGIRKAIEPLKRVAEKLSGQRSESP